MNPAPTVRSFATSNLYVAQYQQLKGYFAFLLNPGAICYSSIWNRCSERARGADFHWVFHRRCGLGYSRVPTTNRSDLGKLHRTW